MFTLHKISIIILLICKYGIILLTFEEVVMDPTAHASKPRFSEHDSSHVKTDSQSPSVGFAIHEVIERGNLGDRTLPPELSLSLLKRAGNMSVSSDNEEKVLEKIVAIQTKRLKEFIHKATSLRNSIERTNPHRFANNLEGYNALLDLLKTRYLEKSVADLMLTDCPSNELEYEHLEALIAVLEEKIRLGRGTLTIDLSLSDLIRQGLISREESALDKNFPAIRLAAARYLKDPDANHLSLVLSDSRLNDAAILTLLQTLDGIPLQRLEIIEGSVELREKKLVQALADCVKTPFFVLTLPRSDVDSIALESIKKARALGSMVTMVK